MHPLFSFPLVSMSATEFIEPFPNSRRGKVGVKFGCVLKLVDCVSVRLTISAARSNVVKQLALSLLLVGQIWLAETIRLPFLALQSGDFLPNPIQSTYSFRAFKPFYGDVRQR